MPLNKDVGNWIKDFMKSNAAQFKGKTKEERKNMALAAYRAKYGSLNERADHVDPVVAKAYEDYIKAKKDSAADIDFAEDPEKAYRYYSKKLNNTYSTRADRDAIEAILKKKYGSALEEASKEEMDKFAKFQKDLQKTMSTQGWKDLEDRAKEEKKEREARKSKPVREIKGFEEFKETGFKLGDKVKFMGSAHPTHTKPIKLVGTIEYFEPADEIGIRVDGYGAFIPFSKIQSNIEPLNEDPKQTYQVGVEDFEQVVQAVKSTGHPATVMLVPKWNEIEIITGMNAPDDMIYDISTAIDSLPSRKRLSMSGDSSSLGRGEYSEIEKVNGGHMDYRRFEESINEEDQIDTVTMDVPLFIRSLEYAKEDAETDMDLHDFAEKAIAGSKQKGMLTMDDYDMLVGALDQIGELSDKADLNKDGKLSSYEKKRGAAIEKAMAKAKSLKKESDDTPEEQKATDLSIAAEKAKIAAAQKKIQNLSKGVAEQQLNEGMGWDYEGKMAQAQLLSIVKNARDLFQMMDSNTQLKSWVQSKLTKAEDYLNSVRTYLEGESLTNTTPLVVSENRMTDDEGVGLNIGDVVKAADGGIYQIIYSYSEGKPFMVPFDLKRRRPTSLASKTYFDQGDILTKRMTKVLDYSATKGGFMK